MNSQTKLAKKFHIHTLGCKVNQYETQAMREILIKAGLKESRSKDTADIYIINTCTVTHHADREARHLVGLFHRINPKAEIVVAGCYVEKNADDISSLPGVAYIVKNDDKARIAEIISDSPVHLPFTSRVSEFGLTITDFKGRTKAFLKIQDGCENRCSYCKVPIVRGGLKSKPLADIINEAEALIGRGFKEIILTGICLGAWNAEKSGIIDVLTALDNLSGDFRIRLSSIEPKYVTDDLISYISKSKRTCRHLHIPLQSGDDRILKLMNRPYTSFDYRCMIEKLRRAMPGIAISTDVMVGFPGETNELFANTLNFVKEISPARTHIFTYSRRDGTPANDMPGEVAETEAKKRYLALKAVALETSYIYGASFIGKPVDVLVETKRDRGSGLLTGYSDNYIRVLFEGSNELMGKIASVKVENMNLTNAKGIYVTE